MDFPFVRRVFSEEETTRIAELFTTRLVRGDVIVLNGNLGAGKTFFVRSAAKAMKISGVNSPTFAIVNEYDNDEKIYHFDFYRIEDAVELFDLGYNDYLNDTEAITFIEWGERLPGVLPAKRYEINIKVNEDLSREIKIEKRT